MCKDARSIRIAGSEVGGYSWVVYSLSDNRTTTVASGFTSSLLDALRCAWGFYRDEEKPQARSLEQVLAR